VWLRVAPPLINLGAQNFDRLRLLRIFQARALERHNLSQKVHGEINGE
jgi:hypothetical protein